MNIPEPSENMFTIYSKSNCTYCTKLELLMEDYFDTDDSKYKKIKCDLYIENKDDKEYFINFIEKLANIKPKSFPMVFYGKEFIGGFEETKEYLKCKMLAFDDEF